jgi:oxygen-independent coproporphyrinogen-3 oxidase
MFGIYVHIPFCKQFCYYCDFYKSANYRFLPDFVKAIEKEISGFKVQDDTFGLASNFLSDKRVRTVYFGGGSPSSVPLGDIARIINQLRNTFKGFDDLIEMTIEINPDDTNLEYYRALREIGFNRLSIGLQSFNNELLKFLHRKHDAKAALQSITDARAAGFDNISIDLIYGIPGQKLLDFENDLAIFHDFGLEHLSAYHLSIEEYTEFGRRLKKKRLQELAEDQSNEFYNLLTATMKKYDYEHYEISNFSLKGYRSVHNSSYWCNYPYIGLGPSAHSYNGMERRLANVRSVKDYIHLVMNELPYYEEEILNVYNRYNEFIINGLRTSTGVEIKQFFKNIDDGSLVSKHVIQRIYKHYGSVLEGFRKFNSKAFISFTPYLKLKEEFYLTADYFIEKLIIDADYFIHSEN